MNELIESDEEVNAADKDEQPTDEDDAYSGSNEDDRSLWDSDDERGQVRSRKEKDAKINNSFTGPYPLDPTDFNHTDKGTNNQFSHLQAVH